MRHSLWIQPQQSAARGRGGGPHSLARHGPSFGERFFYMPCIYILYALHLHLYVSMWVAA